MDENGIDDLLKVVSPGLIAGYEERNLNGKSLSKVNEEYKDVVQDGGMDFLDWAKLAVFSVLVGVILYFYFWAFTDVPRGTAFASMIIVAAPAYFYFLFPARWKYKKDQEIRYKCESILSDFRQSVQALDVPLTRMEEYNEVSVREAIMILTLWLLHAESSFKQIRFMKNIPASAIISYGEAEVACRKHLETVLSAAKKFGLDFNKAEIFRAAIKERETRAKLA